MTSPPFCSSGARPLCGDCPACLDTTNALLHVPARSRVRLAPRPTPGALERHARKYGPALVIETAAEHGLVVTVEPEARPRRASGPSLRARVATLVGDGYDVEAIAEIENLSPSRARRLVAELDS